MTLQATLEQVAEAITKADSIMVTCHRGPDGDSVGSMVALVSLLRRQGKEAIIYTPDLVPRNLKWLPLTNELTRKLGADTKFDATIVVDCGDKKLLGDDFPKPEVTGTLIAIDHHASHEAFGDLFWTDPAASSVGVLVARLAGHLGWELSRESALGLYVSLVSDTGWFRYSNTNAEAFRLAAVLTEEHAVDPWELSERMTEGATLGRYRLLAAALSTLDTIRGGKLAFMQVTAEMVKACDASWEDSEGLVNYARGLRGSECGILITPSKNGGVRVSLRSRGRLVDAGAVCKRFGGGGHVGAAGCTMPGDDLSEARKAIETALLDHIGDKLARLGA